MKNPSNLKLHRKNNEMTISQLAERVGTSEATISRYESGKRNLPVDMAKKISYEIDFDTPAFQELFAKGFPQSFESG